MFILLAGKKTKQNKHNPKPRTIRALPQTPTTTRGSASPPAYRPSLNICYSHLLILHKRDK